MTATAHTPATSGSGGDPDAHLPSLLRVPGSLWFYAAFRALSFAAPLLSSTGRLGLGLIVVLVLWTSVVRRRAGAWVALVTVDMISIALLWIGLFAGSDVRPVVPVLASIALVCLVVPSTRRHLAR